MSQPGTSPLTEKPAQKESIKVKVSSVIHYNELKMMRLEYGRKISSLKLHLDGVDLYY